MQYKKKAIEMGMGVGGYNVKQVPEIRVEQFQGDSEIEVKAGRIDESARPPVTGL